MFMRDIKYYIFIFFLCSMVTGCYHGKAKKQHAQSSIYSAEQIDSISFLRFHHYSRNYNFVVKSDSIVLSKQHPGSISNITNDTLIIRRDDNIVIVDILHMDNTNTDSLWIQVARDQYTFGWLPESLLLANVVPDDPISQFISIFSDTHILVFLFIISLISVCYVLHIILRRNAKVVHFNDIDSFYPTLLAAIVAVSATFYSSIQLFTPDTWRHFYYNPTLNPFSVPPILSMFLCSVWAMVIVGVAAVDDVFHKLSFGEAILYFGGLIGICAINYIVFSITTLYYIGYPLLACYLFFAGYRYFKHTNCRYQCGYCNANLRNKGRCPYCGTLNQ